MNDPGTCSMPGCSTRLPHPATIAQRSDRTLDDRCGPHYQQAIVPEHVRTLAERRALHADLDRRRKAMFNELDELAPGGHPDRIEIGWLLKARYFPEIAEETERALVTWRAELGRWHGRHGREYEPVTLHRARQRASVSV